MTDGLSAAADEAIRSMMAAGGWISSTVAPVWMPPWEDCYYRELAGGWVVVASVSYASREDADDRGWRRGARGALTVLAGVTFPAAERAMALFGEPGNLESSVQPEFAAAGDEGEVRITNRAELLAVAERAAVYLAEVAIPWAREHANLTAWLEEMEGHAQELPSIAGHEIPAMLVAHGRPEAALDRLARFARDHAPSRDSEQAAFEKRLRDFVAEGGTLPESGDELFFRPPFPEVDLSIFDDAGRSAFYAAMDEEFKSASAWTRWKYLGGLAQRGIGAVRSLLDDDPSHASASDDRWRSVAYRPEDESFLAAAFAGAGRAVAHRVDLGVTLRPASGAEADAVDVDLGGRVVGRLVEADRHADVEAFPIGPTPARLTQKLREPRHLLEVQLRRVP